MEDSYFFNHYKTHHSFFYDINSSSDENFDRLINFLKVPIYGIDKLARKYAKERDEINKNQSKLILINNTPNDDYDNNNIIKEKENENEKENEKLIENNSELINNLQIKIHDLQKKNNDFKNELNNLTKKFDDLNKDYNKLIKIEKEYKNLKQEVFNEDSKINLLNNFNYLIENRFIEVANCIKNLNIDELNQYVLNIIDIESYSNKIKEDFSLSFEKHKKNFFNHITKKMQEINNNYKKEILKNEDLIDKYESYMKNDSFPKRIVKDCLKPLKDIVDDLEKKINEMENFNENKFNSIFDLHLPFKLDVNYNKNKNKNEIIY